MTPVGYLDLVLFVLSFLANHGPCSVTMATEAKPKAFFKTIHHRLQYGIQHLSADSRESFVKLFSNKSDSTPP